MSCGSIDYTSSRPVPLRSQGQVCSVPLLWGARGGSGFPPFAPHAPCYPPRKWPLIALFKVDPLGHTVGGAGSVRRGSRVRRCKERGNRAKPVRRKLGGNL